MHLNRAADAAPSPQHCNLTVEVTTIRWKKTLSMVPGSTNTATLHHLASRVLARTCRPHVVLALAFTFTLYHLTALTCLPHTDTSQLDASLYITLFLHLYSIKSASSEIVVQGFEQPWGHLLKRLKRGLVRIWTKPMTL